MTDSRPQPSWLDESLTILKSDGSELPRRKRVKYIGVDAYLVDDPVNKETVIDLSSLGGGGSSGTGLHVNFLGTLSVGDVAVSALDGADPTKVQLCTDAAKAAAGAIAGVVMTVDGGGAAGVIALPGSRLATSVTGLSSSGTATEVGATNSGRCTRRSSPATGEILVGHADTLGLLHVLPHLVHGIDISGIHEEEVLFKKGSSDTAPSGKRYYRTFNVKDNYGGLGGAKGDYVTGVGGTDDTLAIRAAVTALQAAYDANDHASLRLYFPGGLYRITGTIQTWNNAGLSIEGDGNGVTALVWDVNDPITAPTCVASSGGTLTAGDYQYCYSWVDAKGDETYVSQFSAVVTTSSSQKVTVTVPLGPAGTTARKVYCVQPKDGTINPAKLLYVGVISNNSTTTLVHSAPIDDTDFTLQFESHHASPAALLLTSCWHCDVKNFSITPRTDNFLMNGIRVETAVLGIVPPGHDRFGISTRNRIEGMYIGGGITGASTGSIGTCIQFGNYADPGNNDFHQIKACTLTQFGDAAVEIPDSQSVGHVIQNCVTVGYGATTGKASFATMTLGSTTVTHDGSLDFRYKDIGKSVEIVGAGASGARLRTTITQILSPTSFKVADAAGTAVSGATFHYGSQVEYRTATPPRGFFINQYGGSHLVLGGGGGDCLGPSFFSGGYGQDSMEVYGYSNEGGRQLLKTAFNSVSDKGIKFSGIRWYGNGLVPELPYAIDYGGGRLTFENSMIGGDVTKPLQIAISGFYGVSDTSKVVSFRNCSVYSSLTADQIFHGICASTVENCRLHNGSGVSLLSAGATTGPIFYSGGAMTATFGHSRTISLILDTTATITFDPAGVESDFVSNQLIVAYIRTTGALVAWTDTIKWVAGPWDVPVGHYAIFRVWKDISGGYVIQQLGTPLDGLSTGVVAMNPDEMTTGDTTLSHGHTKRVRTIGNTTTGVVTLATIPLVSAAANHIQVKYVERKGTTSSLQCYVAQGYNYNGSVHSAQGSNTVSDSRGTGLTPSIVLSGSNALVQVTNDGSSRNFDVTWEREVCL